MEETADGFECGFRYSVGAVEHVGTDTGPPYRDAIKEVDVVFAERDEVVASEDAN